MIKKLQALRAKKGFTLVELIVVIAIIGVLAAILVPTMMGMVTKSRVTSVDQTAASLRDTVSTWMMDLDSEGGKVPATATIVISVANGTPTVSGDDDFGRADSNKDAGDWLADKITADYNFGSKNATGTVYIVDRKVVGAVYYEGSLGTGEAIPTADELKSGMFNFGSDTDGVMESGTIVGTAPKCVNSGNNNNNENNENNENNGE